MGKDIDAVTVSTPDHNHGVAAIRAMKMGKHCFCQKPLVQTVYEARIMRQLAKEKNLATQMGNQGSAETGLRRAVEVVQAGVIGKPLELHVWSNRPVWPQGLDRPAGRGPGSRQPGLGLLARARPRAALTRRTSITRSTGAAGMTSAPARWATWPATPSTCRSARSSSATPTWSSANWPRACTRRPSPRPPASALSSRNAEDLPPLKFWWYDGNPGDALKPLRPDAEAVREVITTYDKLPASGALIVGEKGKLFSPDDYGARFFVAMKGKNEYVAGDKHEACKAVPQTIPRSPGHMQEWFRMMKEGTPAYSNFDIAAYLTEIILLGCVALRVGEGQRMEWDGPNMRSPNLPEAAQFVKRDNRRGWSLNHHHENIACHTVGPGRLGHGHERQRC